MIDLGRTRPLRVCSAFVIIERHLIAQQLQDILSKLYRPPTDETRQIFTLSRSDAEKLPKLSSIAVISITSPERPPANIGDFAHVLRLSFADVDFLNPDLSEKARGKLSYAFTEEHGHAICSFVEALPDEIASLVIHCEGGYSRSCAVATALHLLYGYKVELQHLSEANRSIVRVMMEDGPGDWKSKKAIRWYKQAADLFKTKLAVVSGNANIIDMQPEYIVRLPDDLRQLVLETEQAIGFQVEVVVAPNRARGIPGEVASMACEVGVDFARVLVAAADQFRPCSVFHELLHIRRFLVEGIPTLVVCQDYEPWTPEIEMALVKHDNAFEHLVIVSLELQVCPESREHWEGVMARVWEDIEAGSGDEVARRQMGLASWAFLQRVLPDSAAIPRARSILQASNDFEHAERFCETLFPLLGDKAVAIRAWFEFLNVPLEMVSLKYWEPLDLRTREVPLGR